MGVLWESRHGVTVSCSRKCGSSDNVEKWSNSRYIRKADPAALANGLGIEWEEYVIYHDS